MYFLIYAAYSLSVINTSSIKILLPDIMLELGVQVNWLTWAANSFTLPFAILMPVCGYVGDRHGSYRFFMWGLSILGAGSVLCAMAPTFLALIVGRVIQAIGAAMMVPNSLTLLLRIVSAGQRTKALGLWGTVGGLGGVVGPVLSGFLVEYLSWRSSFYFLFAFCLIIMLFSPRLLGALKTEVSGNNNDKFDYLGALLLFLFLTTIILTITLLPDYGWNNHWIQFLFLASFIFAVLFVRVENNTSTPMIDLGLIRRPHFYLGLIIGWIEQAASAGPMFILPLYFIMVMKIDAAKAALLLMPSAIAFAIASPLGGKITDRKGFGKPIKLGMFVRMCSFLLLFHLTGVGNGNMVFIIAILFLSGFGHGLTNIPALYSVMSTVNKERYGTAGGIHNMSRFAGTVFGTSISGIIIYALARLPAREAGLGVASEYSAALLFCAGICLVGWFFGLYFRSIESKENHMGSRKRAL